MKLQVVSLFVVTFLFSSFVNAKAESSIDHATKGDWKILLDGKNLDQFRGYRKEEPDSGLKVDDGIIKFAGKCEVLMTKDKYHFFEMNLEWNLPKGRNSGIIYRVAETKGPAYHKGPEIQILSSMKVGGKTVAGTCYALYVPKLANLKPNGQWNSVRLVIKPGNHLEHHMNGEKVCSYQIGSDDCNARLAKSKFYKWKGFANVDKGHVCL